MCEARTHQNDIAYTGAHAVCPPKTIRPRNNKSNDYRVDVVMDHGHHHRLFIEKILIYSENYCVLILHIQIEMKIQTLPQAACVDSLRTIRYQDAHCT